MRMDIDLAKGGGIYHFKVSNEDINRDLKTIITSEYTFIVASIPDKKQRNRIRRLKRSKASITDLKEADIKALKTGMYRELKCRVPNENNIKVK